MLESTMAAASGAGGGLLGQIGDVLSAPRRFAWNALGLPDSGTELLHKTFGMDPDSYLTKGLGMGAEMALDPLTYAGMLLGGPLAKMGASVMNARQAAPLAEEIAALASARRAAQEGLVARAGSEAATVDRYANQAKQLVDMGHDVPGIAGGRTRLYNAYDPALADAMTNAGLGEINDAGQLVAHGHEVPAGIRMRQLTGPIKGQKVGSMVEMHPQVAPGNRFGLKNPYTDLDPLLPDELAQLQEMSAGRVGNRWRSLAGGSSTPDPLSASGQSLMGDWASTLAADANATRPMPSLGTHMRDQFLPTAALTPEILGSSLPDAFSKTQSALAQALARKKALEDATLASALTRSDYAKVAGGSFLGSLGLGSSR